MKQPIFTGSGTAVVTPFTSDGVDYPAFKKLLDFQLENGTDAIIVCGTTGEAATMSYIERMRTIEAATRTGGFLSSPVPAPTAPGTPSLSPGTPPRRGWTDCWW